MDGAPAETPALREKVLSCVYAAIDEANEDREGLPPLEKSPTTPIHGTSSALDSLGLINFVLVVEEQVEHAFDLTVVLGDDRALAQERSPFRSVAALADYIEVLLAERGAA